MASYSIAILKFTWADSSWTKDIPNNLTYSDPVINQLFLPLSSPGIASYWQQCSFGTINLEGSQIFPWRKLNNMTAPTTGGQYNRGQVITQAVQQAQDEGWPLDQFSGIVVWVAGSSNPQDSGSGPSRIKGKWPWAVLYESNNHDFYAHEFGHALGFEHTWGPGVSIVSPTVAPYSDPYCVMAAQNYLGFNPTFVIAADPNGPPSGDPYWQRMAPMPAAATLYQKVPDFAASTHVSQIGIVTANWQRSLTLRARDLPHGNYPVLAVAQAGPGVTGGRRAYLIELRRTKDWDRGIEPAGLGSSPPSGLVIHSLQNLDEYPYETADLETNPKVVYEGNFSLPPTGGDADWHSNSGDFVIRVDQVADDLSWVELTVGGADLLTAGAVTIDVAFGGTSELVEEGVEKDVPVFICGTGDYRFFINHQHTQLRCSATAFGYDNPQFTWQVNGVTVSVGTITVPVMATFPRPKNETKESRKATLTCTISANTLVLTAAPQDGNYNLEIQAIVTEGNPIVNTAPPSSGKTLKKVDTILITWEQKYYDDLMACIKRVKDINDRYAKSRFWPRFNLGDPISKVRLVLDLMQRDLRNTNPILAEQLGPVITIFSQKLTPVKSLVLRKTGA